MPTPAELIARWKDSGGAELANSQLFLAELCTLLEVPQPQPTVADESRNDYVFEKAVQFQEGDGSVSVGRIDLYKKGAFVLESKQGSERRAAVQEEALATVTKQKRFRAGTAPRGTPQWEMAMSRAREQARRYAQAVPGEWPPFLIVVDVGACFDLYADFSQSGKNYQPFPDPQSFRIKLDQLADDAVRDKLRAIWLEPQSLDPAKRAAKVTRELAERLAKLARSLEGAHPPDEVAQFLMRCLFTMFAEDVELGGLKKGDFTRLLESLRATPAGIVPTIQALWKEMNEGCEFSPILRSHIQRFNGSLFNTQAVPHLSADQLELLIEAAKAEWTNVEPAIFGTLLERALDPHERHKLGAHFTPRAYVERLVMPTVIEPLREDWADVYATAFALHESGKSKDAIDAVRKFHEQLCETRVLDPACGSGNFLYVALELMKRLEGEVLKALADFGDKQLPLLTIDPHQFLGIEVNPRAAAIADIVLWIGFWQWHFRTRGRSQVNPPILKKYDNIECRDAVLAWDRVEPVVDTDGKPVTRWDGRTTKPHPVTGEEVPDETARVQEVRYINPRKAEWPKADFIVGNPPFIVKHKMIRYQGEGFVAALRSAYAGSVPDSADFVMYWWQIGSEIVASLGARRFGFITTNSISQIFNRRIVKRAISASPRLSIIFAIPDHPWVETDTGAAVRIAMTVGREGTHEGILDFTSDELLRDGAELPDISFSRSVGFINSKLGVGTNIDAAIQLRANSKLSSNGMMLGGRGFLAKQQLLSTTSNFIRPILNGNDLL